jgi:hypothetical protein
MMDHAALEFSAASVFRLPIMMPGLAEHETNSTKKYTQAYALCKAGTQGMKKKKCTTWCKRAS